MCFPLPLILPFYHTYGITHGSFICVITSRGPLIYSPPNPLTFSPGKMEHFCFSPV